MLPPRAYMFIGLNVIRALSIISLILVFSSSLMTLVDDIEASNTYRNNPSRSNASSTGNSTTVGHDYIPNSTVPNQPAGVFWAVLNRLLIIGQVIILFLSEIGWPSAFFQKFFPVLGDEFGLGALGVIQCLIGAAILSHHVNRFTLVSAFFLFSIGCLNMSVGLILRERAKPRRSLTAWKERAKDVLSIPTDVALEKGIGFAQATEIPKPSFLLSDQKPDQGNTGYSGMSRSTTAASKDSKGFGRQAQKQNGLMLSRPLQDSPEYSARESSGPQAVV